MRRPLAALFWSALLVPAVIVGALGWISYHRALDGARGEARRITAVLHEHALRVLETQETAINWIDARLSGMSWAAIRNSQEVHQFLKRIADESEHIDGIWIVPPDGRTANSADFFPMPEVDASDRDYFRILKQRNVTYLGEMIEGKLKGNLNFNISRRRTGATGAFDGVILVTISVGYFEEFWRRTLPDDAHTVSILRGDGTPLVRSPPLGTLPDRLPGDSPFFALSAASDSGTYDFRSATDGKERLYAFAKLGRLPAYIVVGLDRAAVLSPWKREFLILALIGAATAIALAIVVGVARRRAQRLAAEVARRTTAETSLVAKSEHIAAMERAEQALRDSEERLRAALEASRMGTFRAEIGTGILDWDGSLCRLFGLPEDAPPRRIQEFIALVHTEDRTRVRENIQRMREGGEFEMEFRVIRPDGAQVWLYERGRTYRDAEGRPAYVTGACIDITRRKAAEDRQKLISAELDHRVRNTLAVIRAMLRLTDRAVATKEQFAAAVRGRIDAMARAHGLLTQSGWRGASLHDLVADELAPYAGAGGGRVSIEGPELLLRPPAAVSMALVVHELSTNAAKYGALSAHEGKVAVGWRIAGKRHDPTLTLEWSEYGGPAVTAPIRKGFGGAMLQHVLQHEFGAEVRRDFAREGFRFAATLPLSRIAAGGTDVSARIEKPTVAAPAGRGGDDAGSKVLVVEDDAFIALDMSDQIESLGATVVGPVGNLEEALRYAAKGGFHAALLDMSLGDTPVYPLADMLARQRVPFAFLTGYGRDQLPERFRDTPTLQKPVSPAAVSDIVMRLLGREPARTPT